MVKYWLELGFISAQTAEAWKDIVKSTAVTKRQGRKDGSADSVAGSSGSGMSGDGRSDLTTAASSAVSAGALTSGLSAGAAGATAECMEGFTLPSHGSININNNTNNTTHIKTNSSINLSTTTNPSPSHFKLLLHSPLPFLDPSPTLSRPPCAPDYVFNPPLPLLSPEEYLLKQRYWGYMRSILHMMLPGCRQSIDSALLHTQRRTEMQKRERDGEAERPQKTVTHQSMTHITSSPPQQVKAAHAAGTNTVAKEGREGDESGDGDVVLSERMYDYCAVSSSFYLLHRAFAMLVARGCAAVTEEEKKRQVSQADVEMLVLACISVAAKVGR